MLHCCRSYFKGHFCYVLNNNNNFYRRIEYGICPKCGKEVFRDYKQYADGSDSLKELKGKNAKIQYNRWRSILNRTKQGSWQNQNYCFGDCKIVRKKKKPPIFIQLKRNFNNEYEILGEVETKIYFI